MRTSSKGRVFAHLTGNLMNILVVGALVLGVVGCTDNTQTDRSERVVRETKTSRLEKPYQFGDVSSLGMVEKVDGVTTGSIPPVKKDGELQFKSPKKGSELYWLAVAVYFEARSEPYTGQLKVASVILNRANDPRWPNTIEGVVRQGEEKRHRCQFSFMCDGKAELINNQKAWQKAVKVAWVALEAQKRGVDLGCAHSYHANYVSSKKSLVWFAKFREETRIKTHKFFCDN